MRGDGSRADQRTGFRQSDERAGRVALRLRAHELLHRPDVLGRNGLPPTPARAAEMPATRNRTNQRTTMNAQQRPTPLALVTGGEFRNRLPIRPAARRKRLRPAARKQRGATDRRSGAGTPSAVRGYGPTGFAATCRSRTPPTRFSNTPGSRGSKWRYWSTTPAYSFSTI